MKPPGRRLPSGRRFMAEGRHPIVRVSGLCHIVGMNTNQPVMPPTVEKDFAKDLKAFEKLPVKMKELDVLKDAAEKKTGPERTVLDKEIRDKSQ